MIESAELVFGGQRHLALAATLVRGEARPWPKPFDAGLTAVLAARGRRVCVLASGDPMLHGVGATLARYLTADEMHVIPAPSAFSLAAARLGWALQDAQCLSLHARPVELLRPYLSNGARIIALTSDATTPGLIAERLCALGFERSNVHVLQALGGARERLASHCAKAFPDHAFDALNVVAIEVEASAPARPIARAPGLPDDFFEHDGQMTKCEVRAITLSALAPQRGQLLIDIGAGAGSICIEWMLADPTLRAIAIEADAVRAERIGTNAQALGVPGLRIVNGRAPQALEGLPAADAIFIGGGGNAQTIEAAISLLRSGGRLVANAVTLEMEAALIEKHARLAGRLTRIAISRAAPIGGKRGWRPAMPVTQWSWIKP